MFPGPDCDILPTDETSARSRTSRHARPPDPEEVRQFLALAEVMETWANSLPRWDPRGSEPWYDFADRSYKAELWLADRLRRLPTCQLSMCPQREEVSLTLGGVHSETKKGLGAACRAWAQAAQARVGT